MYIVSESTGEETLVECADRFPGHTFYKGVGVEVDFIEWEDGIARGGRYADGEEMSMVDAEILDVKPVPVEAGDHFSTPAGEVRVEEVGDEVETTAGTFEMGEFQSLVLVGEWQYVYPIPQGRFREIVFEERDDPDVEFDGQLHYVGQPPGPRPSSMSASTDPFSTAIAEFFVRVGFIAPDSRRNNGPTIREIIQAARELNVGLNGFYRGSALGAEVKLTGLSGQTTAGMGDVESVLDDLSGSSVNHVEFFDDDYLYVWWD